MAKKKKKARRKPLQRGVRKTVVRPINFRRTIAYYDRRLPPVLSTPSMIGQMEVAAAMALHPFLPEGAISLGTHIDVSHVAPATVGERVRATAELMRIYHPRNGGRPRYVFQVEARVGKRLLGAGTVERAVVMNTAHQQQLKRKVHRCRSAAN